MSDDDNDFFKPDTGHGLALTLEPAVAAPAPPKHASAIRLGNFNEKQTSGQGSSEIEVREERVAPCAWWRMVDEESSELVIEVAAAVVVLAATTLQVITLTG